MPADPNLFEKKTKRVSSKSLLFLFPERQLWRWETIVICIKISVELPLVNVYMSDNQKKILYYATYEFIQ